MDWMIRTIQEEEFTLKNILFSSFLFHLENKTLPSFSKKKQGALSFPNCSALSLFYSFIWNHVFLNDAQKQDFLIFFCKLQRTYYGFSRFLRIYKFRKAEIAVSIDLFLNPLDPKNKRTCIFFIYKSIYYFDISDIWKLLDTGWTNHSHFEFDLYMPKNPYTNIPFTKTELYHYYFHRKMSGFSIPKLLEYMFQANFDFTIFEMKYESYISKCMIQNTVFRSYSKGLYDNIYAMIDEHVYTKLWKIDPDFPRERLAKIMRPYVYLYYLLNYGKISDTQYVYYSSLLHNSLYLFWKFNPQFGMKQLSFSTDLKCMNPIQIVSFCDKHLPIQTLHL
jgi:hypothetical protein